MIDDIKITSMNNELTLSTHIKAEVIFSNNLMAQFKSYNKKINHEFIAKQLTIEIMKELERMNI